MNTSSLLLSTTRPSQARVASGWLATVLLISFAAAVVVATEQTASLLLEGTGAGTAAVLALFLGGGGLAVSLHLGTGRDFGLWCAPLAVAVLIATPIATVLGAGLATVVLAAWVHASWNGRSPRRRAGMLPGSQVAFAGSLAMAEAGLAATLAQRLLAPSDSLGASQILVGLSATGVAYMAGRGVVGALNGMHTEDSVMTRVGQVLRGLPVVWVAGAAALLGLMAFLANPLALALVAVLMLAGVWAQRHHLAVVAERDRLEHLFRLAANLALAHTVDDAMTRLLKHSAQILSAGHVEVVFFTPPNKLIHGAVLDEDVVTLPDSRIPEATRDLITEWAVVDPHARSLGAEDAHPLRAWLRERGMRDAIICPMVHPEPHGVLVVANRKDGNFSASDLRTAEGFAAHGLETLLRTRREEILAEIEAQHGDLSQPGMLDPLTGLPCNGLLDRHLTRLTDRQTRGVGVAVMSLDHVGGVIASDGRAAGDIMVQEIGRRLMNAVRRTDLIARLDDDRFALVMTGLDDVSVALATCERLATQIARPIVHGRLILSTSASIGIAMGWEPLGVGGESGPGLLRQAGKAESVARRDTLHAVRLYAADIEQSTG